MNQKNPKFCDKDMNVFTIVKGPDGSEVHLCEPRDSVDPNDGTCTGIMHRV